MPIRAVLDTSVIVRGLINPTGYAGRVLREVQSGGVTLITSRALLDELSDVVNRPSIRVRIALSDERLEALLQHLRSSPDLVPGAIEVHTLTDDPKDNPILACAAEARAEVIVTEDAAHLLPMGQFRLADYHVSIVDSEALLRRMTSS